MKVQVKDEQGREVNPFPTHLTAFENADWFRFEQSVKTYPAPGIADGTHECELKWEMRINKDLVDAGIDKEIKWEDVNHSFAEELRKGIPDAFRQKWVLVEPDKQSIPKPPDYLTGYSDGAKSRDEEINQLKTQLMMRPSMGWF